MDWFTIVLYLIMVVAGAVSIYAATYDYDKASMFDLSEFSGKQFLWAGLSFLIGFSLLLIDRRIYEAYAYPLYGFMILLLIVTIFVAPDIKGSRSWLVFGPVSESSHEALVQTQEQQFLWQSGVGRKKPPPSRS